MDTQELQRNEVTLIDDVESLIDRVRTAHREAQAQADKAKEYASKAIDRAYEAGDLLLLLKPSVKHGQWESFLSERLPEISIRQAQNYMKVARELPAEKRTGAFLTIKGALRMLSSNEPEPEPEAEIESISVLKAKSINYLPKQGEMARFIDSDWTYKMTESSKHPGFYWLQRWFNQDSVDDEYEKLCRPYEPSDSMYNSAVRNVLESRTIPCDIYRRPMGELAIKAALKEWKVIDEPWELLGEDDCIVGIVEATCELADDEHFRKTIASIMTHNTATSR